MQVILETGVDPTGAPYLLRNFLISPFFDLCAPESVLEVAALRGDKSILQILFQSAPWSPILRGRALAVALLIYHHELAEDLLASEADVNQEVTIYWPDHEEHERIGNIAPSNRSEKPTNLHGAKTGHVCRYQLSWQRCISAYGFPTCS